MKDSFLKPRGILSAKCPSMGRGNGVDSPTCTITGPHPPQIRELFREELPAATTAAGLGKKPMP